MCRVNLPGCEVSYQNPFILFQVLLPCGFNDILCGRASDWASNGTELCHLAGFNVQPDGISYKGTDEPSCYGGKASLQSIADSWKASRFGSSKAEKFNVEDFQQWVREMPFSEKVSWAVGGMVLTAGILFIRLVSCHSMAFLCLSEKMHCTNFSTVCCKIENSFKDNIICILLHSALQKAIST